MELTVEPMEVAGLVLPLLTLIARATLLGGAMFLVLVLRPLGWTLGEPGSEMRRDCARITALAGLALVACLWPSVRPLLAAGDMAQAVMRAPLAVQAQAAEPAAALLIVLLLALGWGVGLLLTPLAAVGLAAATLTARAGTDADPRPWLLGLIALHQLGVALWLGALPAFAAALRRVQDGLGWRAIAVRYGRVSVVGMVAVLASGIGVAGFTATGLDPDLSGLYGTRYGVLLLAKTALFMGLLALLASMLRSLAAGGRRLPIGRLKRLASIGLALALAGLVFSAALLALPQPMADQARATIGDILARARPDLPPVDSFAAAPAALRTWLDEAPRRAGLVVLAIGALALLACAGLRLARQWPVLVVALGVAMFVQAGRLAWPLTGMADPTVLPHGVAALLVLLGVNEWLVRGLRRRSLGLTLLLPLVMGVGGVALLLLAGTGLPAPRRAAAALADLPLAVLLVLGAVARWQEVRLDPYEGRWAGWLWAGCVVLIGLLLVVHPLT